MTCNVHVHRHRVAAPGTLHARRPKAVRVLTLKSK